MKMTLREAYEMIARGETSEQYEKRYRRIRRLVNERDALEDKIGVLSGDPKYTDSIKKAQTRLAKIVAEIATLL